MHIWIKEIKKLWDLYKWRVKTKGKLWWKNHKWSREAWLCPFSFVGSEFALTGRWHSGILISQNITHPVFLTNAKERTCTMMHGNVNIGLLHSLISSFWNDCKIKFCPETQNAYQELNGLTL
jgi:hypothetical protein